MILTGEFLVSKCTSRIEQDDEKRREECAIISAVKALQPIPGQFGFRNGDASGWSSFDLGVTVDPIFADGAVKLRSRAAPSARIEPHILFLKEHSWLVKF